ncbi:hypothetical protein A3K63_04620 [Candidatus Micrarchaeota archaeon RBG_16_49_10]|nr:MAG: hypothetical protein A3K63_04620 [Candidatus Micrarchaeota archaeon RBG_16_49_10]
MKAKQRKDLDPIRVYWTALSLMMLLGIVSSSFYLRGNFNFIVGNLVRDISYARYRIEFAKSEGNGVTGLFTSEPTKICMESNAKAVPVLLYHGITDRPDGENLPLSSFKEQMLMLKRAGYQTVTLEEFNEFVNGERDLPDKSFLITFDDGRRDSYYYADPVLRALDYNAVMFVITGGGYGGEFYLSERELKQMADSGRWKLESHGAVAHFGIPIDGQGTKGIFYSNKMWVEGEGRLETNGEFKNRIEEDLSLSKAKIEETSNASVIGLAFPYGDYGQRASNYPEVQDVLLQAVSSHYGLVFYQYSEKGDFYNYPNQGTFMIKRVKIEPSWSTEDLKRIFSIDTSLSDIQRVCD